MIEVKYSKKLKKAAEGYLVKCFENNKLGTEAHPNLIAASMGILQGVGWFQDVHDNSKLDAFLDSLQIEYPEDIEEEVEEKNNTKGKKK
jgi:hypothetical protein